MPLVIFLPTILSARRYSAHFWAVPVWSDAIYFYSGELGLGVVPLIGFLTAGLIFRFGMRGWLAMNIMRGGRPGDSLRF